MSYWDITRARRPGKPRVRTLYRERNDEKQISWRATRTWDKKNKKYRYQLRVRSYRSAPSEGETIHQINGPNDYLHSNCGVNISTYAQDRILTGNARLGTEAADTVLKKGERKQYTH